MGQRIAAPISVAPHFQGAVGRYMNCQVRASLMIRAKLLRCRRTGAGWYDAKTSSPDHRGLVVPIAAPAGPARRGPEFWGGLWVQRVLAFRVLWERPVSPSGVLARIWPPIAWTVAAPAPAWGWWYGVSSASRPEPETSPSAIAVKRPACDASGRPPGRSRRRSR
jgi:hypothetical protein